MAQVGYFKALLVVQLVTAIPAKNAEILSITSVEGLQAVNKALQAGEQNLLVTVNNNLNFVGTTSTEYLPMGLDKATQICHPFSGTFYGKRNTLNNIKLNLATEGYSGEAGLFCGLENATIKNLEISSSCSFEGTVAGALSGTVGGNVSVQNVHSAATVTATQAAGGLFAQFQPSDPPLAAPVVHNVLVSGIISSKTTGESCKVLRVVTHRKSFRDV